MPPVGIQARFGGLVALGEITPTSILPCRVGELREALFEAVKSLAHVRDFVGTLISDKHLKWQTYVDLTDAMKIPDINQLLAKTKVEL